MDFPWFQDKKRTKKKDPEKVDEFDPSEFYLKPPFGHQHQNRTYCRVVLWTVQSGHCLSRSQLGKGDEMLVPNDSFDIWLCLRLPRIVISSFPSPFKAYVWIISPKKSSPICSQHNWERQIWVLSKQVR